VMIVCQIVGFLGSGKTTLLVQLGSELGKEGKKVAIIVNEIGEIGVDGAVIDSFGFQSVELTEGCICCTLAGSLQNTLKIISKEYQPDLIIIEPTGIALPNIIKKMVRIAMVGEDAMYTIGIVDAFRAEKLFKEAETFCRTQIDGADIVAINKIDLIDNGVRDKVSDLVRNITPKSKIVFISAKQAQGLESLLELLREAS
jgi:G3E family GTPase